MGRGRPKNAIIHSTAPSEKNQNSSPAQSRCVTVARAKAVKNVWVKIAQIGSRKIPKTNFTQRVGTVSSSDAGTKALDLARATLRTTFPPRFDVRASRWFFDLRFVAAKVAADYAGLRRQKQEGTARIAESPNPNIQAPEKLQSSNANSRGLCAIRYLSLVLLWSLDVGIWSF